MAILDQIDAGLSNFGISPEYLAKRMQRPIAPMPPGGAPAPANPAIAAPAGRMAAPPQPPTPAATPGRTAPAPAGPMTTMPAPIATPAPFTPPAKIAPATTNLFHRAQGVQGPGRIPAEIGAGLLRGLEVAGNVAAPRIAEQIPGSTLNTEERNATNLASAEKAYTLNTEGQRAGIDAAKAPGEIENLAADTALKEAQIGRPKLLTGDQDTASVNGERYDRYMNPDGSTQWVKEGDTPRAPGFEPQTPGKVAPSASSQVSSQGPGRIANPPTAASGSLPPGAIIGKQPVATPEEAAKLAPVGDKAGNYQNRIVKALGQQEAANYPVTAETSTEEAERLATDAEKRASDERASNAPKAAEAEKSRHSFGYTVDPTNGAVVYTTEAKAAENGAPFEPMTPADVKKDRDALGLMGNVQLNASNYKTAVAQLPGPIPPDHSALMQRILADPKLDSSAIANAAGLGAATSIIAQGERATDWNKLTPVEQNAVTQYLRAKGAVVAYQRALTNQGRTNPEALMIELDTIPEPYVGATVALPRFDSFQQNIDQVSQRLPSNLPGVPSVQSVRDKSENPSRTKSPTVGTVEDGYRFKGGNPADKSSWEKAK